MTDYVDQLLGELRQESCVFCRVEAGGRWRIRKPSCPAPSFYTVLSGTLDVTLGDTVYHLSTGDFLVLPHGKPHDISSEDAGDAKASSLYSVFSAAGIERWKPGVRFRWDKLNLNGDSPKSVFLAGLFYFGEPRKNPLLVALPEALLIREATEPADTSFRGILAAIKAELAKEGEGSSLVVARLADLLFAQALRAYVRQNSRQSEGWLRGISDPLVSRAFSAMHGEPDRAWTLQLLAKEAGCSRAMFARRFKSLVGRGALSYLTDWRMHLAAGLLLRGDVTVNEIAGQIGYRPDAFASAFKRWSGHTPSRYRSHIGA